ncbi:hypothetical protein AB0B66_24000 [Catellatospora sp. NPDC049111]|uniref:pPIWI_RE_Y domain-containing protein n=1 Tax=Catellatospora sp. NPDC049111 TaxID=3155271 RepID=UPI00340604EB
MLAEDWQTHPHVVLLHTVASGVIQLADVGSLSAFTLPYPAEAQRALDRMILTCMRAGVEDLPRSVPDLVDWCRTRPLEDWPLDLPADAFGAGDVLVDPDSNLPTQLCHEWWSHGRDSAATQFDRDVIRAAMRLCQQMSAPESYTRFRQLLVMQPVLTAAEQFEIATDLLLDPVIELLGRCYTSAPVSYRKQGIYRTCGRCRTLLTPLASGGWWCERDACRRRGPAPIGRTLIESETGTMSHLVRPLRQFVTGPGRAEVDLQHALLGLRHRDDRLHLEMWPGFDAYDLRISFPDGHVWAVDVKDWRHPGLLGKAAKPIRPQPPYDQGCWVVPQEQVDARPGYMATFYRNRPPEAVGLTLLTAGELVARAQKRLRGQSVNLDDEATGQGAS